MAGNIVTSNYTYYSNANQVKSGEFWYDDGSNSSITMDSFLTLMTAQLANQDFNNAVDDSQFIQQLASYAQIEAMNQLTEYSQISYGAGLVGREVAIHNTMTNEIVYGKVDALNMMNGEMNVLVGGVAYDLNTVVQVYPEENQTVVTDDTDYDKLISTLLDGIAELNSDASDSISSSFAGSLQRLLEAIQELLGVVEDNEDDIVIDEVENGDEVVDDEVIEEVENETTEEEIIVDTNEEIAEENASGLAQEELQTME